MDPVGVAGLFAGTSARWWLSGGAALERWLGRSVREREHTDISTTAGDVVALMRTLPAGFSAWAHAGADEVIPWQDALEDADLQPLWVRDERAGAWVLRVHIEDGTDADWLYRRDPRLRLPWGRAVLEIGGIPTGAPEVQLVWKALRPRPQDDMDRDAVLPELSGAARAWFERAILTVHPHSSWSIHVRSPDAPAKPSWNRGRHQSG